MAMIARSPVWVSWQNTTCSCPLRAVVEGVGVPWGYAGTLPCGLLANTLVTVVALLARPASSSTRTRDKRMPVPEAQGPGDEVTGPFGHRGVPGHGVRGLAPGRSRVLPRANAVTISLRVAPASRRHSVPRCGGAPLRGLSAGLRTVVRL